MCVTVCVYWGAKSTSSICICANKWLMIINTSMVNIIWNCYHSLKLSKEKQTQNAQNLESTDKKRKAGGARGLKIKCVKGCENPRKYRCVSVILQKFQKYSHIAKCNQSG